jgi:hypothetical protein
MQSERSIEIDRPIDQVFRLTHEDVAQWSIVVVEDEVIEEKPGGVGTTFRTVTEDHGKRMEFQGVITAYDPPYAFAVELTGQMFDIEAAYTFEALGSRTKVTQFSKVQGKGFMKLFFLACGWMMNKANCDAQDKELNSLKQYCETYTDDE